MKTLLTLSVILITFNSIGQRPNKSDSFGYETITYLEKMDIADITRSEKNDIQYAKIKNYIERNPGTAIQHNF